MNFTSPAGPGSVEAKSVLLATGVRERPRSARLVPGHRPQGVYTTGSLQRFVYEQGLPVGQRAVIVGAERVSLSVVLTLMHAGAKVLNMITELPHHQLYLPIFLPAKILFADILARTPILTRLEYRISSVAHVSKGLRSRIWSLGKTRTIECDTVVFTGDWIPENELARRGHVETGSLPGSPNRLPLPHLAGRRVCGREPPAGCGDRRLGRARGTSAARSIGRYLEDRPWSNSRLGVQPEAPLAWIYPNVLSPDARVDRFWFRSNEFLQNAHLQVIQAGHVLYEKTLRRLLANTSLSLSGEWVEKVDFTGEPVKLVTQ